MKVLHIALKTEAAPNHELAKALNLGEYYEVDWIHELANRGAQGLNDYILAKSQEIQPDLTFLQIQAPGILDPEVAAKLPGFVVNWTGDVRQPTPQWYFDVGKTIDLTLFTNTHDVDALKKKKLPADYLQVGYAHKMYKPEGDTNPTYPKVVFMGNNYADNPQTQKPYFPLTKERQQMVEHLKIMYGKDFQVYGVNWNNTIWLSPMEEAIAYRSCQIAINQNHYTLPMFSSDRLLRIMGCGAFCLSYKYPGIEKEYKIGKHLDVWESFDELNEKIKYYLHHEKKRNQIALAGFKHVSKKCTWDQRISQLQKMVKKLNRA